MYFPWLLLWALNELTAVKYLEEYLETASVYAVLAWLAQKADNVAQLRGGWLARQVNDLSVLQGPWLSNGGITVPTS